jgi:hypothetical protein
MPSGVSLPPRKEFKVDVDEGQQLSAVFILILFHMRFILSMKSAPNVRWDGEISCTR